MIKKIKIFIMPAMVILTMAACKKSQFEVKTETDPNAAPVDLYIANASRAQINQLGVGLQSAMRNGLADFYRITGTIGREIMNSTGSTEPRWYTELLGTATAQFPDPTAGANDPAGIFNGPYNNFSATRRRAEFFIRSAQNTTTITAEEKKGVEGFAKTIQAYFTLHIANLQGNNGIRETFTDLNDPGDLLRPGPFGTYASALAKCKQYVDDGYAALNAPGAAFPFTMTACFNTNGDFRTVAEFKKVNRAIAARIALYQGDWAGVLTALDGTTSFLDLTGNLRRGPVFIFSTAANDIANGMFHVPNSNTSPIVVFNDVVDSVEAGDRRANGGGGITRRIAPRSSTRQTGPFTSTHEVVLYASNTSPATMINNEELVLMYAEAQVRTGGFIAAIAAIDLIRVTNGLPAYSGPSTEEALINEILRQRRFSLFYEGHRWFDIVRRYPDRLASLIPQGTISGNNYVVFQRMSRPDAEVQWDLANP